VEQKRRTPQLVIPPERRAARRVEDLSKSMSIDELWGLHQEIAATLVAKITAEKEVVDDRLRLLNQVPSDANGNNPAG
jgi:hypothetical protein